MPHAARGFNRIFNTLLIITITGIVLLVLFFSWLISATHKRDARIMLYLECDRGKPTFNQTKCLKAACNYGRYNHKYLDACLKR